MILEQHKPSSSDIDLQKLLDNMSAQIPAIESITPKDVIHIAVIKTRMKVANVLLNRNAILVPEIHEYFKDCVQSIITVRSFKEPPNLQGTSARWNLSDLTATFHQHIAYSCKVPGASAAT